MRNHNKFHSQDLLFFLRRPCVSPSVWLSIYFSLGIRPRVSVLACRIVLMHPRRVQSMLSGALCFTALERRYLRPRIVKKLMSRRRSVPQLISRTPDVHHAGPCGEYHVSRTTPFPMSSPPSGRCIVAIIFDGAHLVNSSVEFRGDAPLVHALSVRGQPAGCGCYARSRQGCGRFDSHR